MNLEQKRALFEEFAQYITTERRGKIERYSRQRTRYITAVLEDVYQTHNISAVLRSCDCFGVQDIHIIEDKHRFAVHEEIAKGSAQWLSLFTYEKSSVKEARNFESTEQCFKKLRDDGYLIVATTPHEKDMMVDELPLDKKVALVFGTEQRGLSSYALEHADAFVKIPMYGFTESFNISVSAGIVLYELNRRLRSSSIEWQLSESEILDLQLEWVGKSTSRSEQIASRLAS